MRMEWCVHVSLFTLSCSVSFTELGLKEAQMSSSSTTDYKLQSGKSGTMARRVLMHTFEAYMTHACGYIVCTCTLHCPDS